MFKKVTIALLLLLLVICVGCSNKSLPDTTSCEQVLNAAVAVKSYDNTKTYVKGKSDMDTFTMSMWADGIFDECEEYDLVSDYAICYSSDNNVYEIAVFQAATQEDTANLVSLIERRKQTLSSGDKAEYDPNFKKLMSDSKVITDGRFVIFLITENNNDVITAIEQLK